MCCVRILIIRLSAFLPVIYPGQRTLRSMLTPPTLCPHLVPAAIDARQLTISRGTTTALHKNQNHGVRLVHLNLPLICRQLFNLADSCALDLLRLRSCWGPACLYLDTGAQYTVVLYCTVLYCTILYCTCLYIYSPKRSTSIQYLFTIFVKLTKIYTALVPKMTPPC